MEAIGRNCGYFRHLGKNERKFEFVTHLTSWICSFCINLSTTRTSRQNEVHLLPGIAGNPRGRYVRPCTILRARSGSEGIRDWWIGGGNGSGGGHWLDEGTHALQILTALALQSRSTSRPARSPSRDPVASSQKTWVTWQSHSRTQRRTRSTLSFTMARARTSPPSEQSARSSTT